MFVTHEIDPSKSVYLFNVIEFWSKNIILADLAKLILLN